MPYKSLVCFYLYFWIFNEVFLVVDPKKKKKKKKISSLFWDGLKVDPFFFFSFLFIFPGQVWRMRLFCNFRYPHAPSSPHFLILKSRCFQSFTLHSCQGRSLCKIRNRVTMVREFMLSQLSHSWGPWLGFLPTLLFLFPTMYPRKYISGSFMW